MPAGGNSFPLLGMFRIGGTGALELLGNSTLRETDTFTQTGTGVLRLALLDSTGVSAPLNIKSLGTFADSPTIELKNLLLWKASPIPPIVEDNELG